MILFGKTNGGPVLLVGANKHEMERNGKESFLKEEGLVWNGME